MTETFDCGCRVTETAESDTFCVRHSRSQQYNGPEIAAIYQIQGGSDSGGVYRQRLKVLDIYQTPDGLVIEVS